MTYHTSYKCYGGEEANVADEIRTRPISIRLSKRTSGKNGEAVEETGQARSGSSSRRLLTATNELSNDSEQPSSAKSSILTASSSHGKHDEYYS